MILCGVKQSLLCNTYLGVIPSIGLSGMKFYSDNIFFYENYDTIYLQAITSKTKNIILGKEMLIRKCRFCNKEDGEYDDVRGQKVTFKKLSHVIPELLGNKKLFMKYECDLCNEEFGKGIENQFGNWSKPMRTMYRIKGKRGVPAFKHNSKESSSRIDYIEIENRLRINDFVMDVSEEDRTVTFCLKRDTYVPRDVLKAFVKIGVSLIPESELQPFKPLIEWIKGDQSIDLEMRINHTFRPGNFRRDFIFISILRRKENIDHVSYAILILAYGNDVFQIPLPALDYDQKLNGLDIDFPFFKFPDDINIRVDSRYEQLDLNGVDEIKNEKISLTFKFDQITPQKN